MWLYVHACALKSFLPSASFVSQHGIMNMADWAWRDFVVTLNMRAPQQPRAKDEDNGRRRRRGGIKNAGDIVNNVHCHAERQHRYSGNHNHLIKTAGFDFQPARKHKWTNTFQPKHPSLTHCLSDIVILLHCVLTLRVTTELFCLCTFFHQSAILTMFWDWAVFGQLPAWHHPQPAVFSCWLVLVRVCHDHSTLAGGAELSGWFNGGKDGYVTWPAGW